MLEQRLRELAETDTPLAYRLAREVVRNESPESIEIDDRQVIVEKPRFRGTHDLHHTPHGWTVDEQGMYETRFDEVHLTFEVSTVDPKTVTAIRTALEDNGFETTPSPAPDTPTPSHSSTPTHDEPVTHAESTTSTPTDGGESTTPEPTSPTAGEQSRSLTVIVNRIKRFIGV